MPVLRPWHDMRPFSAFCAAFPRLSTLTSLRFEGIMPVDYGSVLAKALRSLSSLKILDSNVLSLPSETSQCNAGVQLQRFSRHQRT